MGAAFEIQVLSTLAISLPRQYVSKKKTAKDCQRPLYVMLAMALTYVGILPRAMV